MSRGDGNGQARIGRGDRGLWARLRAAASRPKSALSEAAITMKVRWA